jgi:TRAP-type C4-dicarboxylate transport system permease small subunit
MLRRVLDAYYKALIGLMTALVMALTLVVSYQVFSRYVDFVPRYLWTEEVARFCFIWVLLLGAAIAVREGSHFTIDVLPQSMSPRLQQVLEALVLVLVAAIAALMLFGGLRFVDIGMSRISTTSGIRLAWVYAAVPFSGFSMIVFVAERLVSVLRGEPLRRGSREKAELGETRR